ncbi:MAG: TonB-dependent receptor [Chitinophagales bacterium]|nr:TonB-dependent receptor [Chitinophagales bacterium]
MLKNQLLAFVLLFFIHPCFSQQITLPEAIKLLENRFQITCSYDAQLLDTILVSSPPFNTSLESTLDELLQAYELEYERIGNQDLIIRPFEPKLLDICGYVLEQFSNAPLPYAHVQIRGTSQGTYTDEKGFFVLEAPLKKRAQLLISYLGYESAQLNAWKFTANSCPTHTLKATQSTLTTVTVKEFTTEMLDANNPNGIHFKPQKIPTLPGWGEPDLLRSLQLLPGISSPDESAANLNIRGGSSDQNLILWDNIPIYHTGHFFGVYSSVNPYVAQSIDVYRSGFGAEYGSRVSSVIDIKGKPSFSQKGEYGLGWNLINAHAYAEIPIRREHSALLIAGRRSYTDLIQSATYQNIFQQVFSKGRLYDNQGLIAEAGIDAQSTPSFYYGDLNLKWAAKPNDQLDMSISYYRGRDAFNYDFKVKDIIKTKDHLRLKNEGWSANLSYRWNQSSQTRAKLISSHFENNYNFELQFNISPDKSFRSLVRNTLQDAKLAIYHDWRFHPRHTFKWGAELNALEAGYNYNEVRQGQDITIDENAYTGAVPLIYMSYQLKIPEKFTLELGFRAEGYASANSNTTLLETAIILPRYAFRFHPFDKSFYFQSSGGIYRQYMYQLPAFYNDLGAGEHIWVLANNQFPVLNAAHLSLGFGYTEGHFLMEFEPYAKVINNLPSWNVEVEEGIDNPFRTDGLLVAVGLDALIRQQWNRYNLWAGYTWSIAANQYKSLNDGEAFPTDYDQRHKLNLTHTYSLKHWDFSATFNISSGRPYTAPEALGFRIDKDTGLRDYYLVYQSQNNARLPVYHRMDIAINYKFEREKMSGKLGFSVFNLYNRTNLEDIDFFLLPQDVSTSIPEMARLERPMLSRTPNVFVQLKW